MRQKEPLRDEIEAHGDLLMILIVALMIILSTPSSSPAGGEDGSSREHWTRPVDSGPLTEDIHPERCAVCHMEQYRDWTGAMHSKSAGPGLMAQLAPHAAPEFAVSCYYCHAPLASQSEVIMLPGNNYTSNIMFDKRLQSSGVSCPVCHVREGRIVGPPKIEARNRISEVSSEKHGSHDGFVAKEFFEQAEFCAACHQLDEGYELNGKLLVNTYREWKDSEYGRKNIPCQSCHMPGRRHLFRGIHDPETVRNGVSIEAKRTKSGARLTITNSGAGHYFPTYVTPLVVIKIFLTDKRGNMLKDTLKTENIGRRTTIDLSKELYDTRIPPFESRIFDYQVKPVIGAGRIVYSESLPLPTGNGGWGDGADFHNQGVAKDSKDVAMIVLEVWVFPDEFYNRFFENALKNKDDGMKRDELEEACRITSKSGYLLFKKEISTNERSRQ